MKEFSVVIVAKGNPRRLCECVGAVADAASEVIIVDIGLDSIAKESLKRYSNIRYERPELDVPYVELIREKAKQYASHDYILFLDPDEIVSQQLLERLSSAMGNYDYVSIPRKNIIFQKWIRHSRWWPDYQVRFFKKDAVVWPTVIHAQPETKGRGYEIEARDEFALVHHNYESFDDYLKKLSRYTNVEARTLIEMKVEFSFSKALSKGLSEFISRYFAGQGYKDGAHGLVLAVMQFFYYILVWVYSWEIRKYPEKEGTIGAREMNTFFRKGLYETNHWMEREKMSKKGLKGKIEQALLRSK